jgi:hypothetical protein
MHRFETETKFYHTLFYFQFQPQPGFQTDKRYTIEE